TTITASQKPHQYTNQAIRIRAAQLSAFACTRASFRCGGGAKSLITLVNFRFDNEDRFGFLRPVGHDVVIGFLHASSPSTPSSSGGVATVSASVCDSAAGVLGKSKGGSKK